MLTFYEVFILVKVKQTQFFKNKVWGQWERVERVGEEGNGVEKNI